MLFPCTELLVRNYAKVKTVLHSIALLMELFKTANNLFQHSDDLT